MTHLNKPQHDYLLKFLILGDSGVGKSSLLMRFTDDAFSETYITTIGIDFKIRTIKLDNGKTIKIQIWDTAGQERFRAITTAYYRGCMGILVVYDVTNLESFERVHQWMKNIETHANKTAQLILIGNKSDLEKHRVVSYEQGENLAKKYGIKFYETSSKRGINVYPAFQELAESVIKSETFNKLVPIPIVVGKEKKSLKPDCCQ